MIAMKYLLTLAICFFLHFLVAQSETPTPVANPKYDKALAEKLGANEYGMKSYFLVILKTGSNLTATKEETTESFKGHMANIGRLVAEGKLIVAGPLAKNELQYRGIFILNNLNQRYFYLKSTFWF